MAPNMTTTKPILTSCWATGYHSLWPHDCSAVTWLQCSQ